MKTVGHRRLRELADDKGFLARLEIISGKLDSYMRGPPALYRRHPGAPSGTCVAYFSAEFGIAESLPVYSGGLGVLAGDHLKSASDLGLPLVGVGLLYQEGYFGQHIGRHGQQRELYPSSDFHNMPIQMQLRSDGAPVTIRLLCATHQVTAQVWRAQVGRVPLFLLDANVPANSAEDRDITRRLYGGDLDMRLRQELLLGIGGMSALTAMGIWPTVCHMNEGHTAFAGLERVRMMMSRHNLSFPEAQGVVSASSVFTTHTSVPAGIDRFPPRLMDRYFHSYYPSLGLTRDGFLALGREYPMDEREHFAMPLLAIRLAARVNGVSKLHGEVSRRLWHNVWSARSPDSMPITHVTNGVHLASWVLGSPLARLLDQHLGPRWYEKSLNPDAWHRIEGIPPGELWRAHEHCRRRLVATARQREEARLQRLGAPPREIAAARAILDPRALTIGFARRFTAYKRPTLILREPERLIHLLTDRHRPVQIVFAGKSHPDDKVGKELIQQIVQFVRQHHLHQHIAFVEDYDITVARDLIQGADVWLNTPRRPLEACGTSGMKAALNGVLNMSTLDGWWAEAYRPGIGWPIGDNTEYEGHDDQDEADSRSMYELLEREIIPLFYDRDGEGLPLGWLKGMKAAITTVGPAFSSTRMVREYWERFYAPATQQHHSLAASGPADAKQPAQQYVNPQG
jgi:starch phosphorylase